MATTRVFDRDGDQDNWDQLVAGASGGHLLQSWAWGELKSQFGWRVQRVASGASGAGIPCVQILYRTLPGGLGSIAYVPRGPVADYEDAASLRELLEAIEPLAREQGAICLKVEPNLEDDAGLTQELQALGFRPSPQEVQPRRTILVDLDADPETLLKRMKQKTRYNIRLAGRKGVTVRKGEEADLPAFYQLMEVTAQRDGFGIHSQAYYEAAHRLFAPFNLGCLLLAEHEGQLLAGLVAFAWGDTTCYMYGASANEGRKLMPTYLLQWEAMLWAKEQGCHFYDLWGVPDQDEVTLEEQFTQRSNGLWGVYRFKRGFGGRLVRTVGAWDLVYAPLRYPLYIAAVNWRNRGIEA
jgi:lipid II:glycine glycyltransferase (peptidoglycan interpeptide bridge formation enzyme)